MDGVTNLHWHFVPEAIDGTSFANLWIILKLRLACITALTLVAVELILEIRLSHRPA